jgi:hypothetical protein
VGSRRLTGVCIFFPISSFLAAASTKLKNHPLIKNFIGVWFLFIQKFNNEGFLIYVGKRCRKLEGNSSAFPVTALRRILFAMTLFIFQPASAGAGFISSYFGRRVCLNAVKYLAHLNRRIPIIFIQPCIVVDVLKQLGKAFHLIQRVLITSFDEIVHFIRNVNSKLNHFMQFNRENGGFYTLSSRRYLL